MRAKRLVHRLAVPSALAAILCLLVVAGSGGAVALTLDVTFGANETIAVTLPDGTPVGTASGPPNVIPAGYYTVQITGPMGLPTGLPYFHLSGPDVDLLSNLNEGGLESFTDHVTLQPSSLYTWTDDALPGVTYRFQTSADVLGAAPGTAVSPKRGKPAASEDPIGSDVVPTRGTLNGSVTAAGKLTITFKGKAVSRLKAGSYRIAITDRSRASGLLLAKTGHPARKLSSAAFVGKRSVSVTLTDGSWRFSEQPDAAASRLAIVVSG